MNAIRYTSLLLSPLFSLFVALPLLSSNLNLEKYVGGISPHLSTISYSLSENFKKSLGDTYKYCTDHPIITTTAATVATAAILGSLYSVYTIHNLKNSNKLLQIENLNLAGSLNALNNTIDTLNNTIDTLNNTIDTRSTSLLKKFNQNFRSNLSGKWIQAHSQYNPKEKESLEKNSEICKLIESGMDEINEKIKKLKKINSSNIKMWVDSEVEFNKSISDLLDSLFEDFKDNLSDDYKNEYNKYKSKLKIVKEIVKEEEDREEIGRLLKLGIEEIKENLSTKNNNLESVLHENTLLKNSAKAKTKKINKVIEEKKRIENENNNLKSEKEGLLKNFNVKQAELEKEKTKKKKALEFSDNFFKKFNNELSEDDFKEYKKYASDKDINFSEIFKLIEKILERLGKNLSDKIQSDTDNFSDTTGGLNYNSNYQPKTTFNHEEDVNSTTTNNEINNQSFSKKLINFIIG